MASVNYEIVRDYVIQRLERELPSNLFYHGPHHTRDIVCPAIEVFALAEGVRGEDLLLLRVAALFHDIGFIIRYENNEILAADMVEELLPGYGFNHEQIILIKNIIMATCLPQRPVTLLEQIMCDADLDHLGQEFFMHTNNDLFMERNAYGFTMTTLEWYQDSLQFLRKHDYFTGSARRLRNKQKERNIQSLQELYDAETQQP